MRTIAFGLALTAAMLAQDAPKPPASVKVTKADSPKALKFPVYFWARFMEKASGYREPCGAMMQMVSGLVR